MTNPDTAPNIVALGGMNMALIGTALGYRSRARPFRESASTQPPAARGRLRPSRPRGSERTSAWWAAWAGTYSVPHSSTR